jgi:hypothetical protein
MNSRKLTTILAALRLFQDTITEEGQDAIINMDHFQDGTTPLSPDEIDDLCKELYCYCLPSLSISAQLNPLLAIPWTIHKSIDDKTQEQWIIETVSHDGRIYGICTIHGTGEFLTPERKAIAEIIASIPARIQATDPPPIKHLDEEFTAIIEALDAGNPSRAHWLARKAKEYIANQPA